MAASDFGDRAAHRRINGGLRGVGSVFIMFASVSIAGAIVARQMIERVAGSWKKSQRRPLPAPGAFSRQNQFIFQTPNLVFHRLLAVRYEFRIAYW